MPAPSRAAEMAEDTFPIGVDCDLLFGTWPPQAELDLSPGHGADLLRRAGIASAIACSARGAWFDAAQGNAETLATARDRGWLPAVTVDLRNPLPAVQILDQAVADGVRFLRLFGQLQGVPATSPGYLHVARHGAARGLTMLTDGDVREIWRPFADLGAEVVFLDVHAYHVADFILLARQEPGFRASTRLLNAPDSIEKVVGEVGSAHLAYGSRVPLHSVSPSAIRLRTARISPADRAHVAGGWVGDRTADREG